MYTFPNGKRYIGQTKRGLTKRQGVNWEGYRNCTLLWKAITKYGIDNIQITILYEGYLTHEEAAEKEMAYIEEYRTNANKYKDPAFGYNLTDGGDGVRGWKPTEERLAVLQNQMRENGKNRIGKHASDETRKRLSEAHKGIRAGYVMPQETKDKIGRSNSRECMSEETRVRRSLSKQKPVVAENIADGSFIIFKSRDEAAEYFGVKTSAVTRWVDGTRRPSNGYRFKDIPPTTTE